MVTKTTQIDLESGREVIGTFAVGKDGKWELFWNVNPVADADLSKEEMIEFLEAVLEGLKNGIL